jgi:hypothetical protein
MDYVAIFSAFIAGIWVRELSRSIGTVFRKKAPPAPEPKRKVGDIITRVHKGDGLPVVLRKELSHDKFMACYITPCARDLGAKIEESALDEMVDHLALNVNNPLVWKAYTHPLSDEEHRNYAKAMLGAAN